MRKLATFTSVFALTVFGLAGAAYAGAVYEAPFVAAAGAEVLDSEGKVGSDGSYKVEIEPVTADTDFEVCIVDVNGGEAFLADATSDEDGELKSVGAAGAVPAGNYEEFSFRVRDDSLSDDCSGTLRWASGYTL